jgi:hypothetical protein
VVVGVSAGMTLAAPLAPVALALATAGSRAAESTNAAATTNRPRTRRGVPGSSGIGPNITAVAAADEGPGSRRTWPDGSRAAPGRHAGDSSSAAPGSKLVLCHLSNARSESSSAELPSS